MQITSEAGFKPVIITLETKDELDFFYKVFCSVGGAVASNIFGSADAIATRLEGFGARGRLEWSTPTHTIISKL